LGKLLEAEVVALVLLDQTLFQQTLAVLVV
jgi:hypothetical protein